MPDLILKTKPKKKIGRCRSCKRFGYVELGKKDGKLTPVRCPHCKSHVILTGPYPGFPTGFFNEGPDFPTTLDKKHANEIWPGGRDE